MISIIVPIYQCKSCICNIVEDILKQSYQDYEILLVDDGSTDGSAEICLEYEKKDCRIKAVLNEHQGVSVARNKGISLARGEYIAFIDADDRIEPEYLEKLFEGIEGYDLVISSFDRWFCRHGQCTGVVKNIQLNAEIQVKENFSEYFSKLYVSTLIGVVYCKLFRTDIIKKNEVYFQKELCIGEDYIFNFDYLRNCSKICCIPYRGYHYVCENKDSLTHRAGLEKSRYAKILFGQSVRFANDMNLTVEESKGIYNLYLRTVVKTIEQICQLKDKLPKKGRKSYIIRIIQDEDTKTALKKSRPDTKEFLIYKVVLSTQSPFIIENFSKLRLFYKKMIGRV